MENLTNNTLLRRLPKLLLIYILVEVWLAIFAKTGIHASGNARFHLYPSQVVAHTLLAESGSVSSATALYNYWGLVVPNKSLSIRYYCMLKSSGAGTQQPSLNRIEYCQ